MCVCVCLCVCVSVCVCTHAHVCAEGVMAAESQALGEQHGWLAQTLGRPVGREDESEGQGALGIQPPRRADLDRLWCQASLHKAPSSRQV